MRTITQKDQKEGISDQAWKDLINGTLPKNLSVTVNNGLVTLNGSVDSYTKKLMAEEVVSKLNGVKCIVNNLEVNFSGDQSGNDQKLQSIILTKINEQFNATAKSPLKHPAFITTNEIAYWEIFA